MSSTESQKKTLPQIVITEHKANTKSRKVVFVVANNNGEKKNYKLFKKEA